MLNELRLAFEESQELRDARNGLRTQASYHEAFVAALQPLKQTAEYKQAAQRLALRRKVPRAALTIT